MNIFIELTAKNSGKKFIGNVANLQRIIDGGSDGCMVIGWNNNGGVDVVESYQEIKAKIKKSKIEIL